METGTGKTYVYIRTVLELFRHYGLRIFIVVVPSVAIRESVPAISKTSMAVSPAKAVLDNSIYFSFLFSNTSSASVDFGTSSYELTRNRSGEGSQSSYIEHGV